jgi:hypothetical protein
MATVRTFPVLKIVSDGLGRNTRIIDKHTGEEVLKDAVRAVRWEVDGPGPAKVTVQLMPAAVEVEGECEALSTEAFGRPRFELKRFLVFACETYYPEGGWLDFKGSFDGLEGAQAAADAEVAALEGDGYGHVFDTLTGETWEWNMVPAPAPLYRQRDGWRKREEADLA